MSTGPKTHDTITLASIFCAFGFVILCLLIGSFKTGKMIKGRVRGFDDSPLFSRSDDPYGYWVLFGVYSAFCAFIFGCAIWVMIHGAGS